MQLDFMFFEVLLQLISTHRDLDGDSNVDSVLVVEIDAVDIEPLQAALAGRPHVHWVAADLEVRRVDDVVAELGGRLHLLPHSPLKSLPCIALRLYINIFP